MARKEPRIVSAPVAAGAYPKKFDSTLIHAVEVDDDDTPVSVLCRRVRLESILDDASQYNREPVSCPACLRRLPRT